MNNRFFQRALQQAAKLRDNSEKIRQLVSRATSKLIEATARNRRLKEVREKLEALVRLARAYADGSYRHIPWQAMVSILAAILYFVNPFDLLPDIIPIVGFTDDVSVLLWVFNTLKNEIEAFLQWEKTKTTGS